MSGNAHSSTHSSLQKMSDKAQKKSDKQRREERLGSPQIGLDLNRPMRVSNVELDSGGKVKVTEGQVQHRPVQGEQFQKPSRGGERR